MSKVQTRRSISFAVADFEAAQELAISLGIPLAQLAGQALRDLIERSPARSAISRPQSIARPIAEQVVIDDLKPDSPFRKSCQLAGCMAAPGQACRPVPRNKGGADPELADEVVHQNRLWQVVGVPAVEASPIAALVDEVHTLRGVAQRMDSQELARNLQADLDARVGVLPREPSPLANREDWGPQPSKWNSTDVGFDLPAARRLVAEVSAPGYRRQQPDPSDPIDDLIDRSSVGAGLRNIEERGLDAELEDLEQDMTDHPDAGEVRVVYDEET